MEEKVQSKRKKLISNILLVVECVIIAICLIFSIIVITQPGEVGKNKNKSKFLPVQTDSMTPTIPVGALVITKDASDSTYDLGTIVTFVRSADGVNYLDTHRIVGYKYYAQAEKTYKIEYYVKGVMETEADFLEKYASEGYTVYSYVTRGDKYTQAYGDWDDFGKTKDGVIGTEIGEGANKTTITGIEMFNDPDQFHSNIVVVYKSHIKGVGAILTWFMNPTNFLIVILIPLVLLFAYNIYGVVKIIIQIKVKKAKEESTASEEEIKRRAIEEYLKAQGISVEQQQSSETLSQAESTVDNSALEGETTLDNKTENE